jgi:hypothetical protein
MEVVMPTVLPPRRPEYPKLDTESRALFIATILLLGTLTLACNKFYPPLSGYSLAPTSEDLQLSP